MGVTTTSTSRDDHTTSFIFPRRRGRGPRGVEKDGAAPAAGKMATTAMLHILVLR